MKAKLTINGQPFSVDFNQPIGIGIPISKDENPGCYYTEPLQMSPIRTAGFVGSLNEGGSVNHMRISIAPHGNGTHTECSGHIFKNELTLKEVLREYHFIARLVTIEPTSDGELTYISKKQIEVLKIEPEVQALIIRSQPNDTSKLTKDYSGTNPPFISESAMAGIVKANIEHLIVDLPSVDPEVDGGRLAAHKTFWADEYRQKKCTITELVYIPNEVPDGLFLLNLQALKIELDASPSNPVLYSLLAR